MIYWISSHSSGIGTRPAFSSLTCMDSISLSKPFSSWQDDCRWDVQVLLAKFPEQDEVPLQEVLFPFQLHRGERIAGRFCSCYGGPRFLSSSWSSILLQVEAWMVRALVSSETFRSGFVNSSHIIYSLAPLNPHWCPWFLNGIEQPWISSATVW